VRDIAKVVIGVLIVGIVLAPLTGCGHTKDPFVGTWWMGTQGPKLVIAKGPDGYKATLVFAVGRAPMTLTRHGNELSGQFNSTTGKGLKVVADYQPATGRLSVRFNNTKPTMWSKVAPSPSPSATTFTSSAQHFAVTYDPATFRATTRIGATRTGYERLSLTLRAAGGAEVGIMAIPTSTQYVHAARAVWSRGTLKTRITKSTSPRRLNPWAAFTLGADKAEWAVINGTPGVRVETHTRTGRTVTFDLLSGSEVYVIATHAPAAHWAADAPALNAIAQSFQVTK